MYLASSLSQKAIQFINAVLGCSGNLTKNFSFAVAYVISRRLALPPAQVNNVSEYYILNVKPQVNGLLSRVNELIPFSIKMVEPLVEAFYRHRYEIVYPTSFPVTMVKGRGVYDFFLLTRFFSNEVLEELDKDPTKINMFMLGITEILDNFEKQRLNDSRSNSNDGINRDKVYVA